MVAAIRCAFLVSALQIASAWGGPLRVDAYGDPLPAGAVARLGTVRLRVEERVISLTFSPDQRLLASSDVQGNIVLWRVATGQPLRRFDGLVPSAALAFSPDNRYLAAANQRGDTGCWNIATGKRAWAHPSGLSHKPIPTFLAFLPGGKELLLYRCHQSSDRVGGEIHLIDAATGNDARKVIDSLGPQLETVILSDDGRSLVTGQGRQLRLNKARTGELIRTLDRGSLSSEARTIALSPDARTLAIGGCDTIDLRDVATNTHRGQLRACMGDVVSLRFVRGGTGLVAHGSDDRVCVWNLVNNDLLAAWNCPAGRVLAVTRDGTRMAIGHDGAIRLMNLRTGQDLFACDSGPAEPIDTIAFSPKGKVLAAASGSQTCLWNPPSVRLERILPVRASMLVFSPDGQRLITTQPEPDEPPLMWETGKPGTPIALETNPPWEGTQLDALAFTPSGKSIVAVRQRGRERRRRLASTTILQFQAATGKIESTTDLPRARFAAAGMFRSGQVLLAGMRMGRQQERPGRLRILNPTSATPVREFTPLVPADHVLDRLLPSAGGDLLLLSSRKAGAAFVVETCTGKPILQIALSDKSITALAISASGQFIATAEREQGNSPSGGQPQEKDADNLLARPQPYTIRLWDTAAGKEVCCFTGHHSLVRDLAFSPDGSRLASAHNDGNILLWDVDWANKDGKGPPPRPNRQELVRLWDDLARDDPVLGYRAVARLSEAGAAGVKLIRERVPVLGALRQAQVKPLLAALDSANFSEREAARRALAGLRPRIDDFLHQAMSSKPSPEAARQLRWLLDSDPACDSATLQRLRAIVVLERIGSSAAQQCLQALARGAPAALETRAAHAAWDRLARRPR